MSNNQNNPVTHNIQQERMTQSNLSSTQLMMSSGVGSLLVSLFMTPLDVVKIRLQAQDRVMARKCFLYSNGIMDHICPKQVTFKTNGDPPARALHTAEEICNCKWYNRPKYFNGTLDAIVKISRTEGVNSLWSGLSPTLVLAVPTTMIYFTTYEKLKFVINGQYVKYQQLRGVTQEAAASPMWVSLAAGGLARTWAVTIVNPLELVRTKMQSQRMKLTQVRSCIKDLVKTRGIVGLWSGYTATLLRKIHLNPYKDVPFSALYWPLYEHTKSLFGYDSFFVNFASGALAGSVASTVTLPFDVIKTTKQIEIGERDIMQVMKGQARTNQQIVKDILREQGARGLFSGLTPRILKVAPACAIMISSYEFFKKFFSNQNELSNINR